MPQKYHETTFVTCEPGILFRHTVMLQDEEQLASFRATLSSPSYWVSCDQHNFATSCIKYEAAQAIIMQYVWRCGRQPVGLVNSCWDMLVPPMLPCKCEHSTVQRHVQIRQMILFYGSVC